MACMVVDSVKPLDGPGSDFGSVLISVSTWLLEVSMGWVKEGWGMERWEGDTWGDGWWWDGED